jgi:hypothetical protein
MGAAEAEMDQLADRVKKRGQSWSIRGLQNLLWCMAKVFAGQWPGCARKRSAESVASAVGSRVEAVREKVRRRLGELGEAYVPRQGHVRIGEAGQVRSGGLSGLLRRLSRPGLVGAT